MPRFDIAIFCYPEHVKHLDPLIASIQQHIAGYHKIRIIWDDSNIKSFQHQDHEVVPHSTWPWSAKLWAHGWIRQQILKLQCFELSSADYTWVVDSDILILRSFDLFDSETQKPFLRYHNRPIQSHLGCYDFMRQYFGVQQVYPCVIANGAGNCVFDHAILRHMHQYCEQRNGASLTDLLDQLMSQYSDQELNQWRGYPFSEFETYGNYVHQNFSNRFVPAGANHEAVTGPKDIHVY